MRWRTRRLTGNPSNFSAPLERTRLPGRGNGFRERLLERDAALAELGALWRQVVRGAGRLVFLRGEAGVGKTAVIGRFRRAGSGLCGVAGLV